MMPSDLITLVQLILGVIWGTGMIVLLRRNKPNIWPRILGFGAGTYMFFLTILGSLPLGPGSNFSDYMISKILWSIAVGIMGYFGGRMLARRFGSKD